MQGIGFIGVVSQSTNFSFPSATCRRRSYKMSLCQSGDGKSAGLREMSAQLASIASDLSASVMLSKGNSIDIPSTPYLGRYSRISSRTCFYDDRPKRCRLHPFSLSLKLASTQKFQDTKHLLGVTLILL